jgi:hypothetical protein
MASKGFEHVQGDYYIILDPFGFEEAYLHWIQEMQKNKMADIPPDFAQPYDAPCHMQLARKEEEGKVIDYIADFPEDIPGSALFV